MSGGWHATDLCLAVDRSDDRTYHSTNPDCWSAASTAFKFEFGGNGRHSKCGRRKADDYDGPLQIAEQSQTAKILETAPIVLALAHNWWQWLYLEKQYVSSITDYILSANFLMWLLLLASGTIISLLAVKHSKNKTLGIISLVALAINLILFLVPRR